MLLTLTYHGCRYAFGRLADKAIRQRSKEQPLLVTRALVPLYQETEQDVPEIVVSLVGERFAQRHGGLLLGHTMSASSPALWNARNVVFRMCRYQGRLVADSAVAHLLSKLPLRVLERPVEPCHEDSLISRSRCGGPLPELWPFLSLQGKVAKGILEDVDGIKVGDGGVASA